MLLNYHCQSGWDQATVGFTLSRACYTGTNRQMLGPWALTVDQAFSKLSQTMLQLHIHLFLRLICLHCEVFFSFFLPQISSLRRLCDCLIWYVRQLIARVLPLLCLPNYILPPHLSLFCPLSPCILHTSYHIIVLHHLSTLSYHIILL